MSTAKRRRADRYFIRFYWVGLMLEEHVVRMSGGAAHWKYPPGLYADQIHALVADGIKTRRIIIRREPSYAPAIPPSASMRGYKFGVEDVVSWDEVRTWLMEHIPTKFPKIPPWASGAGTPEARAIQLCAMRDELKRLGVKGWLAALAKQEGLSKSRIKQLLKKRPLGTAGANRR